MNIKIEKKIVGYDVVKQDEADQPVEAKNRKRSPGKLPKLYI